jgi:hypothetical protein
MAETDQKVKTNMRPRELWHWFAMEFRFGQVNELLGLNEKGLCEERMRDYDDPRVNRPQFSILAGFGAAAHRQLG